MKRPIENSSKPGEFVYVYDPFAGSGTTIIAAEMSARKALCIEIDPAYCDVAILRWQAFTQETAIRDDDLSFAELQRHRRLIVHVQQLNEKHLSRPFNAPTPAGSVAP